MPQPHKKIKGLWHLWDRPLLKKVFLVKTVPERIVYQLYPGTIQYNIILFDSSVFLGSGFHNPNYLEISKFLFKISGF